jgi:hypothetical protein
VRSDRGRSGGRELIDFASSPPSRGLEFNARLSVGAVTLTHCTSGPIEGKQLGAAHTAASGVVTMAVLMAMFSAQRVLDGIGA